MILHNPLPVQQLQPVVLNSGFFNDPQGLTIGEFVTQPSAVIQRRTGETNAIYLTGAAIRVCYDIPPPELRSIGGVPVVAANRADRGEGFQTWVWGYFGHTVMAAKWRLRYLLTKPTKTILTGISTPTFPGGATLRTGGDLQQTTLRAT